MPSYYTNSFSYIFFKYGHKSVDVSNYAHLWHKCGANRFSWTILAKMYSPFSTRNQINSFPLFIQNKGFPFLANWIQFRLPCTLQFRSSGRGTFLVILISFIDIQKLHFQQSSVEFLLIAHDLPWLTFLLLLVFVYNWMIFAALNEFEWSSLSSEC